MTQTLTTLVRLAKHKVERAQEALAAAEQKVLELAQWLRATEASREQALREGSRGESVSAHLDAARYDARLKQTVDKLKTDLAAAEVVATDRRQALALVYAEQERYALLLAREEEKIQKRRAAKQQQALDDMGGQRFTRRQDS